jgi:hypothetical protein
MNAGRDHFELICRGFGSEYNIIYPFGRDSCPAAEEILEGHPSARPAVKKEKLKKHE